MTDIDYRIREFKDWENHFEWNYLKERFAPCRVLDIGCGYGYGDIYLSANGFEVTGYDIDKDRIDIAESLRALQPTPIQNRVRFSSDILLDSTYDLVWMSHVLEHISIDQWKWIFDLLPKCAVLVSVPLDHAYDHPQHVNYWKSADDFVNDLRSKSDRVWTASEDLDNQVIRACGIV